MNREIFSARQCSNRLRIVEWSEHLVLFFFDLFKSSVIKFHTLASFMFTYLAIIWTINRGSPQTSRLTHTMLTVLPVEGLSRLESFFISSSPYLNLSYHVKTYVCDIMLYNNCWSISRAYDEVFLKSSDWFTPRFSQQDDLKKSVKKSM